MNENNQQSNQNMTEQLLRSDNGNTVNNTNVVSSNTVSYQQPQVSQPNPKKSKKGLIIVILLLVVAGVIAFVLLSGKSSDDGGIINNNGGGNSTSKKGIKSLYISDGEVAAVDNKGDMYVAIKDGSTEKYYQYYGFESKPTYPVKVASNVKKVYSIFEYLDNNNDYYNTYYRLGGGVHKNFEKIYSGAKDVAQKLNLCAYVIDQDNQLFTRGQGSGFCGYNKSNGDYTLVASDVKNVFIKSGGYIGFYVTNNDELYMITDSTPVKVMDNVKSVSDATDNNYYVLTNNNELFEVVTTGERISYNEYKYNITETKKIADNVVELTDSFYKTSDGTVYIENIFMCNRFSGSTGVLSCEKKDPYAKTTLTDIDTVLDANVFFGSSFVYKTKSGKIKVVKIERIGDVVSITEEKEFENSIDSIDDIANYYK